MTPEEKKIQELEAKIKKLEAGQQQLQEALKKAEDTNCRLRKEQSKLQKKTHGLETHLTVATQTNEEYARLLVECLSILRERFPSDAKFQEKILERISQSCNFSLKTLGANKFFRRLFLKHTEKLSYPDAKQTIEGVLARANEIKPQLRDIKRRSEQAGEAIAVTGKALCEVAKKGEPDETLKAAVALIEYQAPERDEKENEESKGRQSLDFEYNDDITEDPKFVCSCGNKTDFITGAIKQSAVREMASFAHKIIDTVCSRYQNVKCCRCGKVHVNYIDGAVPVTPTSTMGISGAVAAAVLYADGIPLNKVENLCFSDDAKLGHETLGRNIHKLAQDTFKPLENALIASIKTQHTLLADETVINVLQSQGKGICEPAQETRQKDYIAAVCSSPYEEHRAVIFSHLGGRGSQVIAENLQKFNPQVLVTDAYPAYDSFCEEKDNLTHQCCLAHLRRELLDAIDIDNLTRSLNCKTQEEAIRRAIKGIRIDPAVYELCAVIYAISKVYAFENEVKCDRERPTEEYFEHIRKNRNEHARILMDNVDTVLSGLAAKYTKKHGEKYVTGPRNDQLTKALTYYMNHRENFRAFLDDPQIPLDSNAVEASIRAVAVLRKASDFKQSIEYTESLCTLFSLTETAKLNGLRFTIDWLIDYAKAYYLYRASNTLTHEVNVNGRSLDSKLTTFNEGAEAGFNFEPWLPWNYQKKKPS